MPHSWITMHGPQKRERLYVPFTLQTYESSIEGLLKGGLDRITTVCDSDSSLDLWFIRWMIQVFRIVVVMRTEKGMVGISKPIITDGNITGYLLYIHVSDRNQRRIYRLCGVPC